MKKIGCVISLGYCCIISNIFNKLNLKQFSCPFDWTLTLFPFLIDIIRTNFKDYLNPVNLIDITDFHYKQAHVKCSHSIYGVGLPSQCVFPHHDPRISKDNDYFNRCINRFNIVKYNEVNKLYVRFDVDFEKSFKIEEYVEHIFKLYNELIRSDFKNFKLLAIYNMHQQSESKLNIILNTHNIKIFGLCTKTNHTGVEFQCDEDNNIFESIFTDNFEYDIKPIKFIF